MLKTEYDELIGRQNLKASLQPILSLVERMKLREALESCHTDLKTRSISEKSEELAKSIVTRALKEALENEFSILGIGHIKTKLKQRTERGKIWHSLLLDFPTSNRLENILSEGEQRAIAIGSFLAELKLASHKGGIVFDDPVSSLDRHWCKLVAIRITKEAAHRQVIVFTHDTVFLGELQDEIEQQHVTYLIHYLEWIDGSPGHVIEGLPWEHQGYDARLDSLKKNQKRIEKDWQPYPNQELRNKIREQYNDLRTTIERAVQDIVFNDVINRYRDHIRVGKLDKVAGLTEADCTEIKHLYNRCGEVITAHDPSSAKDAPVPTPEKLLADITALETVIQTIKDKRIRIAGATTSTP